MSERQPAEGVRIIKAEEAQAALEAGEAAGRRPDDQLRFGDVPPAPRGPRPAHRFPLPDSVNPAEAVSLPPLRTGAGRHDGEPDEVVAPSIPPPEPVGQEPPTADRAAVPPPPTPKPTPTPTPTPIPAPRPPVTRYEPPGRLPPAVAPTPTGGPDQVEADAPPWAARPAWQEPGSDRTTEMGVPPSSEVPEEGITVSGSQAEMPHWSEPPTGEVPRLRLEDDAPATAEDDLEAWRALGSRGVRWRDEDDWDDGDELSDLASGEEPMGALDQTRSAHSDLYSFDEDFERVRTNRTGAQPVVDLTSDTEAGFDDEDDEWAPPPTGRSQSRGSQSRGSQSRGRRGGRPWEKVRGTVSGAPRGGRAAPAAATPVGAVGAPGGGAAAVPVGGTPVAPTATEPQPRRVRPTSGARPSAPGRSPGRPPVPAGGGGDVGSRVMVGVGLIVVLAIFYVIGAKALVALSVVVVVASAAEAYNMTRAPGFRPATLLGLVATVGCVLGAYWRGIGAIPVVTVLLFGGAMLWYVLGVVEARPLANVAVTIMVFVWVSVLGSFSAVLLQESHGKGLFLGAILVAVAADVGAFVVGRWIGSRPLVAHISPHKTVEGFVGGIVAALIVGGIVGKVVHPWSGMRYGLILGLVVGIIAPAGDLFESMLKRDLGIKDSGSILGGHGGLLDRFDGILLALPAAYFVATIAHL